MAIIQDWFPTNPHSKFLQRGIAPKVDQLDTGPPPMIAKGRIPNNTKKKRVNFKFINHIMSRKDQQEEEKKHKGCNSNGVESEKEKEIDQA